MMVNLLPVILMGMNERPPRKMLTAKRLVNSIDKSLDETCHNKHNVGMVENDDEAVILTGDLGRRRIQKQRRFSGQIPCETILDDKDHAIFGHVLRHQLHFFPLLLELNKYPMHSIFCFQLIW